jgi:hypothetical protein
MAAGPPLQFEAPNALLRWRSAILVAAIFGFACKLALAWCTTGTNDMRTWEADLHVIRTEGGQAVYKSFVPIYEDGKVAHEQVFNHPPLMIAVLSLWGRLEDQTAIPLRVWLRGSAALADLGSLILLYLAARKGRWPASGPLLCILAASPVAIFISGFHGNTDPIMLFLILASAYAFDCRNHLPASGLLLGLAMGIKVVPILLIPAVIMALPTFRQRAIWSAAAAFSALLPVLPYLRIAKNMARNVLGYSSIEGIWGLTFLYRSLHLPHPYPASVVLKWAMLLVIVVIALWFPRRPHSVSLFHRWGTTLFLFLAAAPGFGIQYLSWLSPWPTALGLRAMLAFHSTSGLFIAVVYTLWSGGIPWDYANSYLTGWYGWMQILQLSAWLTIVVLTRSLLLRAGVSEPISESGCEGAYAGK